MTDVMRLILIASLVVCGGCTRPSATPAPQLGAAHESPMNESATGTVEELLAQVDGLPAGTTTFEMFVPQNLSLHGQPVSQDIAMAIVVDRLLAKDLYPNGYNQRSTGRRYRYGPSLPR